MSSQPAALYSIRDVAEMTSLSETTLRDSINKGFLKAVRVGNRIRIKPIDLNEWIESLEVVGK